MAKTSGKGPRPSAKRRAGSRERRAAADEPDEVRLLAGGNPQIAKADGDAPVQAYIAAMPAWKCEVGERLDRLIVATVPEVKKAVKWNNPLYGVEGLGWTLSYRCFTKYVKVTFFKGSTLEPEPPIAGKDPDARHFKIVEGEPLDEDRFVAWVEQASRQPGWMLGEA